MKISERECYARQKCTRNKKRCKYIDANGLCDFHKIEGVTKLSLKAQGVVSVVKPPDCQLYKPITNEG